MDGRVFLWRAFLGYENFSEISTSESRENRDKRNHEEIKEIPACLQEKSTREFKKKSRDFADKINGNRLAVILICVKCIRNFYSIFYKKYEQFNNLLQ